MKQTIRDILVVLGALFIGIILHEIYHMITLHDVSMVCLKFGSDAFATVYGQGESSEVVAYAITLGCWIAGIIFIIRDKH